MRSSLSFVAGLASLVVRAAADPTWPAPTDELEEIMYQLQGFKARLFTDTISPCSNEAAGPGRLNSAEWLRTGFHDMSTANVFFGTGGLDASLQYELGDGENPGPGFNTTFAFLSNYFSTRASMADLIAAGVYASVRSCGGPVVPIRAGRVDATKAGSLGVPQVQNPVGIFTNQFQRMGFNATEMIQLVACGHTLGGVHTAEFPDVVPAGSAPNGQAPLDSTDAVYDNKIATEYIAGNTSNPLVVGPSVALGKNADGRIFASDGNVTMKALTDPTVFQSTCQTMLQRMIEVVPAGVVLSADPVTPYQVKPVDMQLTLQPGGTTMLLTGYIRVRTTNLPLSSISSITLTYQDRSGGSNCGSGSCSTTATVQGVGTGFDDSFGFFPISTTIYTASGISAYTITINLSNGQQQTYDNNGNLYPLSDAVLIQNPQSCLLQGSGALTVSALVRNDRTSLPVSMFVSYLVPRTGLPTPGLQNATVAMTAGTCVGSYTFYNASFSIPGGMSYNARIDITSGTGSSAITDGFNAASEFAGSCESFSGAASCSSVAISSVSSTATSTQSSATSVPASSGSSIVSTTATTTAAVTPTVKATLPGYNFVSCWTEASSGRALKEASFAYDGMTLESCMANCTGYNYWGTEYGRECYCGQELDPTSTTAPLTDCNVVCSGDPSEFCGGGLRLELYSTTASIALPTGTLAVVPTVGSYQFVGCQTEGNGVRALSADSYADNDMTLESCATFCNGYTFFGCEYARECYCGNSIDPSSQPAAVGDCNMPCDGNPYEYCGAGNRLELYSLAPTSDPATSTATASSSPSSSQPSTSATPSASASSSDPPAVSSSPSSSGLPTSSAPSASASSSDPPASTPASSSTSTSTPLASSSPADPDPPASGASSSASTSTAAPSSSQGSPDPPSSSATGPATSSSTAPPASSTGAITPVTLAAISPFSPLGCYTEGTSGRALADSSFSSASNMTLQACASFCDGFRYFGVEYETQCWCGDRLTGGSRKAGASECAMSCSGDAGQTCGGADRLSVYVDKTVPETAQPARVGKYEFLACRTEATTGRALDGPHFAADNMTLLACAQFCKGYQYFGCEYSRECYCGSAFEAGSRVVAEAECNMQCSGASSEYCGAGNRLSVYELR